MSARTLEIARFLVAGVLNTAATYALYLVLLPRAGYAIAYTLAYLCGIGIAYLLNTGFVFRSRRSWRSALLFPLVYVLQYLLGLLVLNIAIRYAGISQELALCFSIGVTLPVTYLLSRLLLTHNAQTLRP